MGAVVSLDAVLRDPRVFRSGRSRAPVEGLASGFAPLDEALPWGGFPRDALSELLLAHDGLGELSLLLPMLAQAAARGPVLLVSPPYLPYAPALAAMGLDPRQVMEVRAPAERTPWAMEQALRAGCCGAVLGWHGGADDRALRRLQVAAESGRTPALLFRPLRHAGNASPAALRLAIEPGGAGSTQLRVIKCRGAVAPAQALAWGRS